METEKENKTVRIGLDTWIKLNSMRGLNSCKNFEDVIKLLLNEYAEKTQRD